MAGDGAARGRLEERGDHGAARELRADDRGPLEHGALARPEPVEAGGEQRLDRRRQRPRGRDRTGRPRPGRAAARGRAGSPRRSRRSSAGVSSDSGAASPIELPTSASCVAGERGRASSRRSWPARKSGRSSSSSSRARQSTRIGASRLCATRCSTRSSSARLRPVQVVEDEHERALAGERLEQAAERPGDLARRGTSLARPERGDARSATRSASSLAGDERPDRLAALAPIALADDLGERPVRDPLAVGEAAAARAPSPRSPRRAASSRASRDLPIPGGPSSGDEPAAPRRPDPRERPRAAARARGSRPTSGTSSRRSRPARRGYVEPATPAPAGAPSAELERARRARVRDEPCGALADHDLARRGRLLEPRGDADRRRHVHRAGLSPASDLARLDPDARHASPRRAPPSAPSRASSAAAHRPERVVLVRDRRRRRRPSRRHRGTSRPVPPCRSTTADAVSKQRVEHAPQRLGVERRAERGDVELGDEDRHELPLPRRGTGLRIAAPPGAASAASWRRIARSSSRSSGPGSMPELVDEQPARRAGRRRARRPGGRAVEREHQLRAEPLAQRLARRRAPRAPRRARRAGRARGRRRCGPRRGLVAAPRAARSRPARTARS